MKTIRFAAAVAIASLAMPQLAFAEETEAMPAQATPTIVVSAEHQRDWNRGNRIEADGLRDLQRAQRDLVRYSADVVSAQNKRDTSLERAANAQEAFENLTARPFFSSADQAHEWAKQVEAIAKDWEEYGKSAEESAHDLSRAQRRQANAQKKVDEANIKISEGRTMMADAERLSRLQANQ